MVVVEPVGQVLKLKQIFSKLLNLFLHFYLIRGEFSHEWVGWHSVIVIFVNRNPIEVHQYSAGEVTAFVVE